MRGAALAIGSGATGGYALPFDLDPTLANTASGANCPLRQLARVQVLTVNARHFVTANGVVASYGAEASAMTEAGPTLRAADPHRRPRLARSSPQLRAAPGLARRGRRPGTARSPTAATPSTRPSSSSGTGTNEPLGILTVGTGRRPDHHPAHPDHHGRRVVAVGDAYAALQRRPAAVPGQRGSGCRVRGTYSFLYRLTPPTSSTEPMLHPRVRRPAAGQAGIPLVDHGRRRRDRRADREQARSSSATGSVP